MCAGVTWSLKVKPNVHRKSKPNSLWSVSHMRIRDRALDHKAFSPNENPLNECAHVCGAWYPITSQSVFIRVDFPKRTLQQAYHKSGTHFFFKPISTFELDVEWSCMAMCANTHRYRFAHKKKKSECKESERRAILNSVGSTNIMNLLQLHSFFFTLTDFVFSRFLLVRIWFPAIEREWKKCAVASLGF